MAKNRKRKDNGLSLADILCTIGLVSLLAAVFFGYQYADNNLGANLLKTFFIGFLLILFLLSAKYIKKSKPYNRVVWTVVEYALVGLFVAVCIVSLFPLNRFVNIEMFSSKELNEALSNDNEATTAQIESFVSKCNTNLSQTVTSLGNYMNDHNYNGSIASRDMKEFIRNNVNGGTNSIEITKQILEAYRDKETESLNELRRTNSYKQAYDAYQQATFLTRPHLASKLIKEQHEIYANMQKYANMHPYPAFEKDGNRYIMDGLQSFDFITPTGEFESKIKETESLSIASIIVAIVLGLLILLPYFVTKRNDIIKVSGKNGSNMGGQPLIFNYE